MRRPSRGAKRRVQASVSPQLQALIRLVSLFSQRDVALADAMVMGGYSMRRAGAYLGESETTIRQRLTRLVMRVERHFPAVRIERGPATPEIHFGYDPARFDAGTTTEDDA